MESDELEYIQVDIQVESSSENNTSKAILVTDTGEQLEPDMMMN